VGSVLWLLQLPLASWQAKPGLHWKRHFPASHPVGVALLALHGAARAPQHSGSLLVSLQLPSGPWQAKLGLQVNRHFPATHPAGVALAAWHREALAPQQLTSLEVSLQLPSAPLQAKPGLQVKLQAPPEQEAFAFLAWQGWLQPPQCSTVVLMSVEHCVALPSQFSQPGSHEASTHWALTHFCALT
jgi:hypothetical protein